MKTISGTPQLGEGLYTIPEAARILHIPMERLRRWVTGYIRDVERILPLGEIGTWGQGADRHFNFYTLIELYSVFQFRELGLSMQTLSKARNELSEHLNSPYPFAHQGLVSDGKKLMFELKESSPATFLELGSNGQTLIQEVMEPFCSRLDFHNTSKLAERYWPVGKSHSIVVDPHHSFGQPTICGTNITTETLNNLLVAGETVEDVAEMFDLEPDQIVQAQNFEHQLKAA